MYSKRKLLSQNFLRNRKLAALLVSRSSIGKKDLVLEIGPGKGILTQFLLQQAGCVQGIEIDPTWCQLLREQFADAKNLLLYQEDFLSFKLPNVPYKVFANIPFSIEGKIIRKLIDAENPPEDCYLVTVKDLAFRLSGRYGLTLFTLAHTPWFEFSIEHSFQPDDFNPRPHVSTVLFRFRRKHSSLLPWNEKKSFTKFLSVGFGYGRPVFINLQSRYPREKIRIVFQTLSLHQGTRPSRLSLGKWVQLYQLLVRG